MGAGVALAASVLAACGDDSDDSSVGASSGGSTSSSAPSPAESTPAGGGGGGGGGGAGIGMTPVQRISAASDSYTSAGTARLALTVAISTAGEEQKAQGEGVLDTEAGAMQMKMTAPGQQQAMEIIAVDDAVYMRGMPDQPDKWMKMEADQAGSSGFDTSSADPSQTLQLLRSVSDGVKEAGTETIRGVEATKYTGELNLKKALDAAEGQSDKQKRQAERMLKSLGVDSLPFEIYLDEENRPVRIVQTVDAELGEEKLRTTTTMDLYDWGTEATIEAPDPADVVEMGQNGEPNPAPTAI
jgi:hypothetical protein